MENKIKEAMCFLDAELVQEAAQPAVRKKRKFRTLLVAACLAVMCAIGVAAVSGGLLVKFYHNGNVPDSMPALMADGGVDAYYEVSGNQTLPLECFSEQLLTCAAQQGAGAKYYPFENLEEIETFLGWNFPENPILEAAAPVSTEVTDEGGKTLNAPGSVCLYNDREGRLTMVMALYTCQTRNGWVSLSASAATDDNLNGSIGSMGVDYEGGKVLRHKEEHYLTAAGRECTMVSTQNSVTDGWDVYGWIQQDGYVLRLSLSGAEETAAQKEMKQILDAFQ